MPQAEGGRQRTTHHLIRARNHPSVAPDSMGGQTHPPFSPATHHGCVNRPYGISIERDTLVSRSCHSLSSNARFTSASGYVCDTIFS